MVTTLERSVESREQAIRRLAEKARESGVRLTRDRRDGRHYASSASRPGTWHYVTGYSCDCQGFATHGRCMHHSALLVALGWIGDVDPEPDPDPPASISTVECAECLGSGHTRAYFGGHLDDWEISPCHVCCSTGTIRPAA